VDNRRSAGSGDVVSDRAARGDEPDRNPVRIKRWRSWRTWRPWRRRAGSRSGTAERGSAGGGASNGCAGGCSGGFDCNACGYGRHPSACIQNRGVVGRQLVVGGCRRRRHAQHQCDCVRAGAREICSNHTDRVGRECAVVVDATAPFVQARRRRRGAVDRGGDGATRRAACITLCIANPCCAMRSDG
jgi:hypothetical protein